MNPVHLIPVRSFWQRRVVGPVLAQLKQGSSPEKIAETVAVGVAGGLFPIPGLTTLLCFILAVVLRLNQPTIHLLNQLLWPVQLAMMVVYVRLGSWIFGTTVLPFDPAVISDLLMHSPREFWTRFGLLGLHAIFAWLLTVPVILSTLYFPLRPVLRSLAANRRSR